mgnify:CR=1 FL=1
MKKYKSDKALIIPLAINTEYIFTWNRTGIGTATDDAHIGLFKAYPKIGDEGRHVGSIYNTGGSLTFTTTNVEHYAVIKIAHTDKTNFD